MDFVLAILVLALALLALAYPLYRARTQTEFVNSATLDELLSERDGVYATLRDLELDRQMGKLDDTDYNALHDKYMIRASRILKEIDILRGEGDGQQASREIEEQVAVLRGVKSVEKKSNAQAEPNQSQANKTKTQGTERYCTNCGRPYKPGDKFCARCGRALDEP